MNLLEAIEYFYYSNHSNKKKIIKQYDQLLHLLMISINMVKQRLKKRNKEILGFFSLIY
jgi:hypothetical protein